MNVFVIRFDGATDASQPPGARSISGLSMNITLHNTPAPASGFGLGVVEEVGDCLLSGGSDQPAKNDFRTPDHLP